MIHYSYTKKFGVLKGWIFPHFSNKGIKINFHKMIFFIPLFRQLQHGCPNLFTLLYIKLIYAYQGCIYLVKKIQ